jgi:hypothetical protein
MFLEVINLLGITTVDDKRIKMQAWKRHKDKDECNNFQWPRIPSKLSPRDTGRYDDKISRTALMSTQ